MARFFRDMTAGDQRKAQLQALIGNDPSVTELRASSGTYNDADIRQLIPALGKATHLVKLTLTANIGYSNMRLLSSALAKNNSIVELDLSNSHMDADGAKLLGSALGKNSNVKSLRVLGNNFGEKGIPNLATGLAASSIASLDLGCNKVDVEGARALGALLASSKTLTSISLVLCSIDDAALREIATGLAGSTTLTTLILKSNRFVDASEFGVAIGDHTSLATLSIAGNDLSPASLRQLFAGVGRNRSLKSLDLARCRVNAEVADALGEALATNSMLETLDLSDNPLTACGKALGAALARNTALKTLIVTGTEVDAEDLRELCAGLESNTTLLSLHLSSHSQANGDALGQLLAKNTTLTKLIMRNFYKLGDENVQKLVAGLARNQTLETLDLATVRMTAASARMLADAVGQSKITTLDISSNEMGDSGLEAFIPTLGKMTEFSVSDCKITGVGAKQLARVVASNTSLKKLSLAKNWEIKDDMHDLIDALKANSTLTTLDIDCCGISNECAEQLLAVLDSNMTLLHALPLCDLDRPWISFSIMAQIEEKLDSPARRARVA